MPDNTKQSVGVTTNAVYEALSQHSEEEQINILRAVNSLLGITPDYHIPSAPTLPIPPANPSTPTELPPANPLDSSIGSAEDYFAHKDPNTKIEQLATAAHYLEKTTKATSHSKEDIKATVESARRNFDSAKFSRDMDNAKVKGLFNKGGQPNSFTLSFYGKNYLDALPDREAVKRLKSPKKTSKKKAKKKPAKK
ncbi:MAG: hypothetical protein ACSHX5_12970 [Phycisphaerales bacterium]